MATADLMTPAVELIAIEKRFGTVRANAAVDLSVARGSIHGIVGENGAGKSTLMSILYGFYQADSGDIRVNGQAVRIRSSAQAIRAGIGMVHQHFMLVETLSVLENVMLGAEGGVFLKGGQRRLREELAVLARDYGLSVDPDAVIGTLSVGLQQRVEIIKALTRGADILILDEPTAVLTPSEADQLFVLLQALKRAGKTVILITHKLREIMHVTDRVSVMRRGAMLATFDTAATTPAELAEVMVGRRVLLRVEKVPAAPGIPVLQVTGLTVTDARGIACLSEVSLTVRAGEIVGIAGVAGNGQSELLEVLAGMRRPSAGHVQVGDETLSASDFDPQMMRRRGVLHIPEDRLRTGLVAAFPAYDSAALGWEDERRFGDGWLLNARSMSDDLSGRMDDYDVRPRVPALKTAKFSGGNQQKIVLAREIERRPLVLLVGQPTRGVDIGAIEFIHKRLIALRDAGAAILLVSVELDEIRGLADRIVVMCGGRITGERVPDCPDGELGLLMAGITGDAA